MRFTLLGCGPSSGVPLLTGDWGRCDPNNPKNRRTRTSLLVQEETEGTTLLIDASPDVRHQLLRENCERLDGVVITHDHFDHSGGLDELRPFFFRRQKRFIPMYATKETARSLQARFDYLLKREGGQLSEIYPPFLEMQIFPFDRGSFSLGGLEVETFRQDHGALDSLGLRIGNVAYSTDVVNLTAEMEASLEGLDVWFVDCMSEEPRPTHAHLEKTLSWIEQFKPKQAYLIHMDRFLDYESLCKKLPPGVFPGYDGMIVTI